MDKTDWAAFVQARLPWAVVTQVDNLSVTAGGLSGQMMRVHLQAAPQDACAGPTPPPTQLIVKRTMPGKEQFETDLGTTREALFYKWSTHLPQAVQSCLAHVYYAAEEPVVPSSSTGTDSHSEGAPALKCKVLILEDLSARHGVQAGYFFGPYSLHNWGKDLVALTAHFSLHVTARAVLLKATRLAGRLHARFWCEKSLLTGPEAGFLRAASWFSGSGKAAFDATVQAAVQAWESFKVAQAADPSVTLHPTIRQLLDDTCAHTDFETYVAQWRTDVPWTLVHGDYHPANMMVVDPPTLTDAAAASTHGARDEDHFALMLLDWEVVGVGSGPQELGQFVISHASRSDRQAMEDEMLQLYRDALRSGGLDEARIPSLDAIRTEYVRGGLARWCWLFPLCAAACPPAATQFFHDQMFAFLEDHQEEARTVTMMRP